MRAGCGLTAKIGNRVGGPEDYLPTEWLADDSLVDHGSRVYNKVGVVTPLSTWARHNYGTLDKLDLVANRHVCGSGNWIYRFRGNS